VPSRRPLIVLTVCLGASRAPATALEQPRKGCRPRRRDDIELEKNFSIAARTPPRCGRRWLRCPCRGTRRRFAP
jgi:hypothetical protein